MALVIPILSAVAAVPTITRGCEDLIGKISADCWHRGPKVCESECTGPFYVIYRSNNWGSSANGADGLVAEDEHKEFKHALECWNQRKVYKHAYGIADRDGRLMVYSAKFTTSFSDRNCKRAICQM